MTESKVDLLASYIRTRDMRIAKDRPWSPTPLLDSFLEMLGKGTVRVGGRATCGAGSLDPTWKIFSMWNEVVAKARKLGLTITQENIKQTNAWATKARGFWNESEFSTPVNPALRAALAACTPAKSEGR